jgi:hypothetical protein
LLQLKISFASTSSLVETAISRGVSWALTVRTFHHGAFSRIPDAAIDVTGVLSGDWGEIWPFFIWGDFNDDGRPDFVIRRSATEWNIFCSTTDGRWFAPKPALAFETPLEGNLEVRDINGDGRSDLIFRPKDDARMFIFLSQSQRTKGNP